MGRQSNSYKRKLDPTNLSARIRKLVKPRLAAKKENADWIAIWEIASIINAKFPRGTWP